MEGEDQIDKKPKCYLCSEEIEIEKFIKSLLQCRPCYTKTKQILFEQELKTITSPEIDQITDKIFLGNWEGGREKNYLKEKGITHILVCGYFMHEFFPEEFAYKTLELEDFELEDISKYFKDCIEFIEKADKIFVHCRAGISRSSSMVIAYIMWKEKLGFEEAKKFVRSKRCCIWPNEGFEKQLREFAEQLKKNNYEL
jgi:protein-tyrosine phosphatase